MKLIDIEQMKSEAEIETCNSILEQLQNLQTVIKEGRLNQLVVQYDEKTVGEESKLLKEARTVFFWNQHENNDEIVGFVQRLLYRLTAMAEGEDEDV